MKLEIVVFKVQNFQHKFCTAHICLPCYVHVGSSQHFDIICFLLFVFHLTLVTTDLEF